MCKGARKPGTVNKCIHLFGSNIICPLGKCLNESQGKDVHGFLFFVVQLGVRTSGD